MAELLTLIVETDDDPPQALPLPPGYQSRPCQPNDIEALGTVYFAAFERGEADATVEDAIEDIGAFFGGEYGEVLGGATQLVQLGGELAAAILTVRCSPWSDTPDCPFVIELFTARGHRRRGLARVLLQRCLSVAGDAGQPVALRVRDDNAPARRLYGSLGFRPWVH